MKIALIGAGSHFFESVFLELGQTPELHGAEVVLYDIDAERMQLIDMVGRRISDHFGAGFRISSTQDLPTVLEGANIAITSIGVHGPAASWHKMDVEAVARFGIMQTTGDTVGPSGFSQGLRIIPIFIELTKAMEKYCPDCIILNHSNPMAAICRTVKKYSKIKIIGYCHNVAQSLPIFAGLLDVEATDLDFLVGGINHMTWLLSLRHKGRDVYPELKRRILNSEAQKGQQFTKDLLQAMDLFMMGGDRHIIEFFPHARQSSDPKALHYGLKWRSDMISENLLSEELTRGAAQLQARAEGTKPLYIPKHVTPEAMGQQIKALTQGPDIVHVVNIPNEGAIPNLPDWALVEVKAVVGQHGARPVFVGDLPAQAARWTLAQIYAHELTIEAAAEQSRSKAIQALACDPMIRDFHEAEQVLDALIEVQGDRLNSFVKK
jgi:alpha-galactosidase